MTIGSIYALVGLGYTMVCGVRRMINFAHGDIMMTGAFAGFFVAATDRSALLAADPSLAIALTLAVSIAVSTSIAVLTERLAYRPFRHVRGLAPLICAIGVLRALTDVGLAVAAHAIHGVIGPNGADRPRCST